MPALDALLVVYRVHWGLSSRTPWGSVVQPSYLLPPPTTILGALAKALHSLGYLKTGEFVEKGVVASGAAGILDYLGDSWLVSAAWLSPCIRAGVLIRYFNGPYQSLRTRHVDLPETLAVSVELFGPYKLGYTISPHGLLAVLVAPYRGELLEAALHVSRIGAKEGFVDPVAAYRAALEEGGVSGVTPWLTPAECLENVEGNYVAEKTPLPYTREELICAYSAEACTPLGVQTRITLMREAVHPRYPGWARVAAKPHCRVYRVGRLEAEWTTSTIGEVEARAKLLQDTIIVAK